MRVSCIQMDMAFGCPAENFQKAEALMRSTVEADQPDLILLPETWNTGFSPKDIKLADADTDGQATKSLFSRLAAELSVNIAAGSVSNIKQGKLYNTAYVFDRTGNVIAEYDKTHLFSPMGEDRYYEKGGALCRFMLDGVSCGLIICYDLRFPELIRSLTLPGLDLLLVVSQWPLIRKEHLVTLARARAIENQMFVALCNSAGRAGETQYGGHSVVYDPWGEPLCQATEGEAVITADANFDTLTTIRATIPVFQDRRPDLYKL